MKRTPRRSSLIVRCSRDDAARVRTHAAAERRTVSGYVLYILDRSFWVEGHLLKGLDGSFLAAQARFIESKRGDGDPRTALHLRCSAGLAQKIRAYAARRELSISDFVMFSLWRSWDAVDRLRQS
jgi:hypothetical protein